MEKQPVQIIPYLAFHGNCEEALKPHPVPDDAGCGAIVRDGFGITWIITCPNPAKTA